MLYALLTSMILNFSISPDISHENENQYNKNKIDNYDIITISQSGSLFYSVTNQILQLSLIHISEPTRHRLISLDLIVKLFQLT